MRKMARKLAMAVLCGACAWLFSHVAFAADAGWTAYGNARFGYWVEHPDFLKVVRESENGDGAVLASPDGRCELTVWGSYNVLEETLEGMLEVSVSSAEERGWETVEDSKVLGDDFFAVSYRDGEFCVDERGLMKDDVTAGFQLRYPASEAEKFAPIARRMATNFRFGDAGK